MVLLLPWCWIIKGDLVAWYHWDGWDSIDLNQILGFLDILGDEIVSKWRCICCNKIVENGYVDDNPMVIPSVYKGVLFRAPGNFGSTVFDSLPGKTKGQEILQVIICDDCLKKNAKRVMQFCNIRRNTIADVTEFRP